MGDRALDPWGLAGANLTTALLAGEWAPGLMAARLVHHLGCPTATATRIALVAVHAFPGAPRDQRRMLASVLAELPEVRRLAARTNLTRSVVLGSPSAMGTMPWPVPRLDTTADLADWLGLSVPRLKWMCDVRGMEAQVADERLRHYRSRWLPTRSGGRLIEAPKPLLALFQRRVLREILNAIPSHPTAHGFVRGRSVHSFVAPHVGRPVLVRVDLASFFPSVGAGRVYGVFRGAGYPETVAHLLTGLATTTTPLVVRRGPGCNRDPGLQSRLRSPHLPQGAPTSPALANLCVHRLDRRLTGLATAFAAVYTRYADDLAFSGAQGLAGRGSSFLNAVNQIVRSEGFHLHPAKTRVATRARQQRLTGLVINERANLDRQTWDGLKAKFRDAAVNGPDVANRTGHAAFQAHLLGLLSWTELAHPIRAARLRADYDKIIW